VFSSSKCPNWLWGPSILYSMNAADSFFRVKCPKFKPEQSPPSTAEVYAVYTNCILDDEAILLSNCSSLILVQSHHVDKILHLNYQC
jgi:hypothetical protein